MKTLNIPYDRELTCVSLPCRIDTYRFTENTGGPLVNIYSCHNKEKLKFKFRVYEPVTEVKSLYPDFPREINKDSTVSLLLQPYVKDPRNLILRMNAAGAYFISFGQWYWNRADCTFEKNEFLKVTSDYCNLLKGSSTFWEVTAEIDLALLFGFLGVTEWKYSPDTPMRGNFLKIKKTPEKDAHFGMWNEVTQNTYHCYKSELLGEFILE